MLIKKILTHLQEKAATNGSNTLPESRAPPPIGMPSGLFY
ncbi:MAG: hypothetical protein ACI909_001515 [Planctomycetota bacterium]|jgi:hypothetical protein